MRVATTRKYYWLIISTVLLIGVVIIKNASANARRPRHAACIGFYSISCTRSVENTGFTAHPGAKRRKHQCGRYFAHLRGRFYRFWRYFFRNTLYIGFVIAVIYRLYCFLQHILGVRRQRVKTPIYRLYWFFLLFLYSKGWKNRYGRYFRESWGGKEEIGDHFILLNSTCKLDIWIGRKANSRIPLIWKTPRLSLLSYLSSPPSFPPSLFLQDHIFAYFNYANFHDIFSISLFSPPSPLFSLSSPLLLSSLFFYLLSSPSLSLFFFFSLLSSLLGVCADFYDISFPWNASHIDTIITDLRRMYWFL